MSVSSAQTVQQIEASEIRQIVEHILSSKYFVNSQRRRKFLKIICDYHLEGRSGELNEYLLGVEVLGLDKSFDPGSNPAVRVLAHEVRKKLGNYYESEGLSDAMWLEIPVGRYQPVFTLQREKQPEAAPAAIAAASPALTDPAPQPRRASRAALGFGVTAAVLAGLVIWLAAANLRLRRDMETLKPSRDLGVYGPVWSPFISPGAPVLVVLNNLTTVRATFPFQPPVVQDHAIELSSGQSGYWHDGAIRSLGPGTRYFMSSSFHTSVGEAVAAVRVANIYRSFGQGVIVKQSRLTSLDEMKDHHAILLGSHISNEWSGKFPLIEEFFHTARGTIGNRHPQPGEAAEYGPGFDEQGRLKTDYALITVKPNISEHYLVMVLAGCLGVGSQGAGEFVTSPDHLNKLNEQLRRLGGENRIPRYFQALLKVHVENHNPTAISVVAMRELVLK